jgi:branched-subunit amino acid ABC-type transport system permease component
MDINYILQNTIIYGSIAFALTSIFNNHCYLNFSIWIFLVAISYIVNHIFILWFDIIVFLAIILLISVFYLLDYFINKLFPNKRKRELFGIIFTLWFTIFCWNMLLYFYWSNALSLNNMKLDNLELIIILWVSFFIIYYLFKKSFIWKILRAISENSQIVDTIWIKINFIKSFTIIISIILLFISSYIILSNWSIHQEDNIFFLIKWVWVMIIVWTQKIEYIFLWALLYVLLEHILFINIWLAIAYKESLVLIVILLMLLFKPTWLFSSKFSRIL